MKILQCTEIFPNKLTDYQRAYLVITDERMDVFTVMKLCPIFPRIERGACEDIRCMPIGYHYDFGSNWFEVYLTFAQPVRISAPLKPSWFRRWFK